MMGQISKTASDVQSVFSRVADRLFSDGLPSEKNDPDDAFRRAIHEAVVETAAARGVKESTVHDHVTRQIGYDGEDALIQDVKDYALHKNPNLQEHVVANRKQNTYLSEGEIREQMRKKFQWPSNGDS